MKAVVTLVVARAANGTIGANGSLPWRLPEDLRRFKALTLGKPCIMGRKTWESLPKKPLPGRTNIVVTRDLGLRAEGAVVVHSLADALEYAEAEGPEEIAVIGGAEIFRAALPHARRIHLTEVHAPFDGDVLMPSLDPADWKEAAREERVADPPERFAYSFIMLERR
jgi:dihydrofolate reductase